MANLNYSVPSCTGLRTPPPSVTSDSPSNRGLPLAKRWWNINVPEAEWTEGCPEFLAGQVEKNINIMSIKDEDHPRMSWEEVANLIDSRRIDQFHRMPADLRRYIKYCHSLKQRYGSVLYFMQHERLNWPTIDASGDPPFSNAADYKILLNDWPYSIDQNIIHVVVWTKFTLADDPVTGELTEENKAIVEDFVVDTFCESATGRDVIDRNDLRWFKNWTSLRSIHALGEPQCAIYD